MYFLGSDCTLFIYFNVHVHDFRFLLTFTSTGTLCKLYDWEKRIYVSK